MEVSIWTRKPQEQEGNYYFSGTFLVTRGVNNKLSQEEIAAIYLTIQQLVEQEDGLDYLQVFVNQRGDKLFFMDQLSKDMIEEGEFKPEDNYCTLMFSHEY